MKKAILIVAMMSSVNAFACRAMNISNTNRNKPCDYAIKKADLLLNDDKSQPTKRQFQRGHPPAGANAIS